MTPADRTDPNKSQQRPEQHPVRPTNNVGHPTVWNRHEDVDAADAPLYHTLPPDRGLQHRALRWVGLGLVAGLLYVCVVAIAIGSVPGPLATAILVLASTLMCIALYNFPRSGKTTGRGDPS